MVPQRSRSPNPHRVLLHSVEVDPGPARLGLIGAELDAGKVWLSGRLGFNSRLDLDSEPIFYPLELETLLGQSFEYCDKVTWC